MNGCNVICKESKMLQSRPPQPTKDCRVCNRRRIKCDRATPSCKKCDSRNLTCPGYGLKLNWDWGVASRGKLAGKSLPSLSSTAAPSVKADRQARSPIFVTKDAPSSSEVSASGSARGGINDTAVCTSVHQQTWNLDMNSLMNPPSMLVQDSTSRRLFHHYGQVIAASMVWVDSDTNPWRTIMMPMALESPSLLISILALAAEHLSVVLDQDNTLARTLISRSTAYRDRALQLLAVDMRSTAVVPGAVMLSNIDVRHRNHVSNSLLASMLVLCNMETVRPESTLWRVHLDAARTVVNLRGAVPLSDDDTFDFLVQQYFITDAFACTTSFAQIDENEILTEDADSVFIEYLRLVRRVTALERQAAAGAWPNPNTKISPAALRSLFEQARDRTLSLSFDTHFTTLAEREQFSEVVESFHHAGLLYSYRCLSYAGQEDEIRKTRLSLFQNLDLLPSDHPGFAQDVVWPLFIAGTEARSEDGTRVLVERKLQQAMKRTGFSNCEKALVFLRALWSARDDCDSTPIFRDQSDQNGLKSELNWIHCARDWTSHGHHFLVF